MKIKRLALLSLFMILLVQCKHPEQVKIGISKASPNYIKWLKQADSSIILIDLYKYTIDSAMTALEQCSGLLLSGGEDVYPGWYGREYDTARCMEINRHRDSLEMALISKALELKMPVFGICRGEQILNVYLGGKLIIDLPKDYSGTVCHQCENYLKCFHSVKIVPNTILHRISVADSSIVTSNHHQAIDIISPLLTSNASSNDQLSEGIEWLNPEGKSFLMGVQWHPERMVKENPLSGRLAKAFVLEVKQYSKTQNNSK